MRVVAVIQARLASRRLPGKVLLPAPDGRPLLAVLLERVQRATLVDAVWVATTHLDEDAAIEAVAEAAGVGCAGGPVDDVLARFLQATAPLADDDLVVRLTGDNPLVDPQTIDRCVGVAVAEGYPYVRTGASYPEGLDVEVLTVAALRRAEALARLGAEREHVTYVLRHEAHCLELPEPLGHLRVTVDEAVDVLVVNDVLAEIGPSCTLTDLLRLARHRPDVFERNAHIERNEGLRRSLEAEPSGPHGRQHG